jgi:hypothetical protein
VDANQFTARLKFLCNKSLLPTFTTALTEANELQSTLERTMSVSRSTWLL